MSLAELLKVPSEARQAEDLSASADAARSEVAAEAAAPGETAGTGATEPVNPAAPAPVESTGSAVEPAAEPQARETRRAAATETSRPGNRLLAVSQVASLGLVALGGVLLTLPLVSTQAAEFLASHSTIRGQSGMLVVVGLCLFTLGLLRQGLREIRQRMETEAARVQKIALDRNTVHSAIEAVRSESTALMNEVGHLHTQLKSLTEIVSSPEFTVSNFRLAASVDQLGMQVDTTMKAQFARLQQQLEGQSTRAGQFERQWSSVLRQMPPLIGQIPPLVEAHQEVQQLTMKEGFDGMRATAQRSDSRVAESLRVSERIESAIQQQSEIVSSGLDGLSQSAERNALAAANAADEVRAHIEQQIQSALEQQREIVSTGLEALAQNAERNALEIVTAVDGLRAHVERLIQGDTATAQARFEQLDGRLDEGERNVTAAIAQISERVRGHFAQHVEDLRDSLNLLAELTGNNHKEVVADLQEVGNRVDIGSSDHAAALRQAREQTEQSSRATRDELAASLRQLRGILEELQGAHCERILEGAQQTSLASTRELAAELRQLDEKLERQARDQGALSIQSAADARQAVESARSALIERIEELGAHLAVQFGTRIEAHGARIEELFEAHAVELADSRPYEPVFEDTELALEMSDVDFSDWAPDETEIRIPERDEPCFAAGLETDALTIEMDLGRSQAPASAPECDVDASNSNEQESPPAIDPSNATNQQPFGDGDVGSTEFRYP